MEPGTLCPSRKQGRSQGHLQAQRIQSQEVRTPSAREGVTTRAWVQTVAVEVAGPTHPTPGLLATFLDISLDIFAEGRQSRTLNGG